MMSDQTEIIVASDTSGLLWNVCMWDSRTGTSLMTYKGAGVPGSNCLCLLGNDYLLAGEKSRPLIHAWALNSSETSQQIGRIVCPGCVTALAVSPSSCYCVAGINEKLYIWEIASGTLMTIATRHYQTITCIKFTDDGSHFVSAGHDGMVLVWPLAYLVSQHTNDLFVQSESGHPDPRYIFSDHSLPVGDLFIGRGGMRAKLLSVSGDRTCKIYDLASGTLLLSVVFDSALSAVTMHPTETQVFVGAVNGSVYNFSLLDSPRSRDYHPSKEEIKNVYIGHTKAVTCLSASLDGIRLLSGSSDGNIILWDIESKLRIRTIQCKGPITNAFFTLLPKHVFSDTFKPSILLQRFKKNLEVNKDELYTVVVMNKGKRERNDFLKPLDDVSPIIPDGDKSGLEDEIMTLKKVNQELYKFAVEKVMKW